MTALTSMLLHLGTRPAAARFDRAARQPMESQLAFLRRILDKNADTAYGREHGFAKIRGLEDWRKSVPIVDYEAIRDYVERMANGDARVLTAEDPLLFAQTSGTTGHPKLIPVTPTCLAEGNAGQMRAWLHHAGRDHPAIFRGRILSLVSPAEEGRTLGGVPYGSTSGHIYMHLPQMLKRLYAIPYPVFEIHDYATKYYLLLRIGLVSDVTFFCTANPSSILKLCETADERSEELIRDVRDGTLCVDASDATRELTKRLGKDPERAAELERCRSKRGGRLLPADYWPRLALLGCWKGGTVGGHVPKLAEWFDPDGKGDGGGVPIRDWGWLASEVRGSVPLSDEGCGGVLTVGLNLFEFVDAEELEAEPDDPAAWHVLDVSGLRRDREYYVFVTTTGGLYRYDMNDVVAVTGFHHTTPIIEFRRKGRGMTSITGEKVSVSQVIDAFEGAAQKVGVQLDHFKAEADSDGSRYVFKVEAHAGLAEPVGRDLLQELEQRLGAANGEYRSKRESLRLKPPVLLVMREGWYESGRTRDMRDFQRKTIKLSEADDADREFVVGQVTLD